MSSFRYILPALAVAGSAAAATCSVDATTTIQNAGDATGLATCQTFTGSIAIATGTSDNIDLSGIEEITGDLVVDSAQHLTTLTSTSLETIQKAFILSDLTILSTLSFPKLTTVTSLNWTALPALGSLSSLGGGIAMASEVSIQNTYLSTLDGINLEQVDLMSIANNNHLTQINMQLGNVSNALEISANGNNVSASFPNLIWANNVTIANVSSFSAPSLAAVNGSLGFYNDYFSTLSAPNLTNVDQSLSIVSCGSLTNISFPVLTTVGGGLTVANNTQLKGINGFPALQNVGGAVDYYGNFSNASLPALTSVKGAFNIQSTADLTSTCGAFSSFNSPNGVVAGQYQCQGSVTTPSDGVASGGSSTSSSSAHSSSPGAASNVQISAMTGVLGVVAAIFGMM